MALDSVLGSGARLQTALVAAGSNRGIFADTLSLQISGVLPVKVYLNKARGPYTTIL